MSGLEQDETVSFWAEWHGVRYKLGSVTPPDPMRVFPPDQACRAAACDMSLLRMPQGRVALEIDFQPCLYREEDDPDDMPDRESLFVRSRRLLPGDYLVLSRERFKNAMED